MAAHFRGDVLAGAMLTRGSEPRTALTMDSAIAIYQARPCVTPCARTTRMDVAFRTQCAVRKELAEHYSVSTTTIRHIWEGVTRVQDTLPYWSEEARIEFLQSDKGFCGSCRGRGARSIEEACAECPFLRANKGRPRGSRDSYARKRSDAVKEGLRGAQQGKEVEVNPTQLHEAGKRGREDVHGGSVVGTKRCSTFPVGSRDGGGYGECEQVQKKQQRTGVEGGGKGRGNDMIHDTVHGKATATFWGNFFGNDDAVACPLEVLLRPGVPIPSSLQEYQAFRDVCMSDSSLFCVELEPSTTKTVGLGAGASSFMRYAPCDSAHTVGQCMLNLVHDHDQVQVRAVLASATVRPCAASGAPSSLSGVLRFCKAPPPPGVHTQISQASTPHGLAAKWHTLKLTIVAHPDWPQATQTTSSENSVRTVWNWFNGHRNETGAGAGTGETQGHRVLMIAKMPDLMRDDSYTQSQKCAFYDQDFMRKVSGVYCMQESDAEVPGTFWDRDSHGDSDTTADQRSALRILVATAGVGAKWCKSKVLQMLYRMAQVNMHMGVNEQLVPYASLATRFQSMGFESVWRAVGGTFLTGRPTRFLNFRSKKYYLSQIQVLSDDDADHVRMRMEVVNLVFQADLSPAWLLARENAGLEVEDRAWVMGQQGRQDLPKGWDLFNSGFPVRLVEPVSRMENWLSVCGETGSVMCAHSFLDGQCITKHLIIKHLIRVAHPDPTIHDDLVENFQNYDEWGG